MLGSKGTVRETQGKSDSILRCMHYSRRTRVKLATPTEKRHGQQVDGQTDDSYKVRYIYIYEVYMSVCIYILKYCARRHNKLRKKNGKCLQKRKSFRAAIFIRVKARCTVMRNCKHRQESHQI